MVETKEWTLMFFFASDNPLAPGIVSQLKAIKEAGFHPEANVIAQFDPHTVNTPVHIFDVNLLNKLKADGQSQAGFKGNDPYVRNLVSDKLWEDEGIRRSIRASVNNISQNGNGHKQIDYNPPVPSAGMSGEQNPKAALSSFLDFCRKFYPARHYVLIILGHGLVVGNDLFLFDEHAPQSSLSLTDLGDVMRDFKANIDEDAALELIGFHSCSMSGVEVACELKGTANYMLASQGPAFVGSWPYRQILLRIFNDLNSSLLTDDLLDAESLIGKLKKESEPVYSYLRSRLKDGTNQMLDQGGNGSSARSARHLHDAVRRDLNTLLSDQTLFQAGQFRQVKLSKATEQLITKQLEGDDLGRFNRLLLADACPKEIAKIPQIDVKKMLTKIFYYCLYNSYDYQLAGYSFDLCLCDLNKIGDIEDPLTELSQALMKGLDYAADPLAKDLILLAHWEAQSFWQESYTDLYDFCFRLQKKCVDAKWASEPMWRIIDNLIEKTETMMEVLRRGVAADPQTRTEADDDRLIVRCEFAGPLYQYAHGLSIFFPWSEPVGSRMWEEQYERYRMSRKTLWQNFLRTYFDQTKRNLHSEEGDPKDLQAARPLNGDQVLLETLRQITNRAFNNDGQLNRGGSGAETSILTKPEASDPAGSDCDCGSIKNYPSITRVRPGGKDGDVPTSPNFFRGLK